MTDRTPTLTPISAVKPRALEWLFPPFVPKGKLTVVVGQMGQGKSLLTALWAAEVTKAGGSVLMFATEDDAGDTLRPRLEAAGADLDRVVARDDDALDTGTLAKYCDELGDVKLVTVDPLTAFFGREADPWNTPKVRKFLRPLAGLAQERGFALVGLVHTNRWSDSADPLSRIAEAQGIPQVARSVLVLGPDPLDDSCKVLATAKANLSKGKASTAFRIEETTTTGGITAPRLARVGESTATARDLLIPGAPQTPAVQFLLDALADGPRLAGELETEAAVQGITEKMLRTARRRLKVHTQKRGDVGAWEWSMPQHLDGVPA